MSPSGHPRRAAAGPTVSVALCTYNGERYIEEQLRSILDQETPAMEIVISDDGSTDNTVAIITSIAAATPGSPPIRLVHTSRVGGVTRNFDRTIAECRGDIIALSDQDDRWAADRLTTVVNVLDAAAVPTLVFGDAMLIDGRGNVIPGTLRDGLRLTRSERARLQGGRPFEALIRRNVVTGAVTAFTRDLYELSAPFPELWVHDEWLAIMAAGLGRVIPATEVLGAYRLHDANQIGIPDGSVGSRLTRMLAPRADRYVRLRDRSSALAARLAETGAPTDVLRLARRKQAFEGARARYPKRRVARLGPVLVQFARGNYRRLSSQGAADVIRDLAQPA